MTNFLPTIKFVHLKLALASVNNTLLHHDYLAPGGGCEVLFSLGLSVCVSVCVSGQYFGILFLSY